MVHRPLHQALPGGQIHDVVLVDPRGAHEQGDLVGLLGRGLVLDQLDQIVAEHHLAVAGCHVVPQLEGGGVHLAGPAAVVDHVADHVAHPPHYAQAARLGRPAQGGRVGGQEVGGGQGVGHQGGGKAGLGLGGAIQPGSVHHLGQQLALQQVRLQQAVEHGVLLPGRLGEPAVFAGGGSRAVNVEAEGPANRGRARPGHPHGVTGQQAADAERITGPLPERLAHGFEQTDRVDGPGHSLGYPQARQLRRLVFRLGRCNHRLDPPVVVMSPYYSPRSNSSINGALSASLVAQ